MKTDPIIRFNSHVEKTDSCWIWIGALLANGYGSFSNGEKNVLVHRYSYEIFVGPIPEGLTIDHLCRNRACVNPEHLEPVTRKVNAVDRGTTGPSAVNSRKTHCIRGHSLSGINLFIHKDGRRACRICKNESNARKRRERYHEEHPNARSYPTNPGGFRPEQRTR